MSALGKIGAAAVAAVTVLPVLKDHILYGRKTQLDRKMEKLIQEKGFFFGVPTYQRFKCGDGQYREKATVCFGRLTPYPVPLGLLSAKEAYLAKRDILWEPDQNTNALASTEWLSEKEYKTMTEDPQTLQDIIDFCDQALNAMRYTTRISKAIGFKSPSQEIMEKSLPPIFGDVRPQRELWDQLQRNQILEAAVKLKRSEEPRS